MSKEELKSRYDHLYKVMAESKQPEKMMLFGKAEKHMFHELAEAHPEAAEAWLAMLEPVEIGRTLISCNDPAEHPYDVARIEEMHIDSMRPQVIELIVTMR